MLPIEKIVRKRIKDRGEIFVEDDDEHVQVHPNIRTNLGEISGSARKDDFSVDGLSEIMKRSNADMDR